MNKPPLFKRHITLLLFATTIYCMGWLGYYGQSAMGRNPVYPDRCTMDSAIQLASGDTLHGADPTPPAYPFLLSLLLRSGLDESDLVHAIRVLNLASLLGLTLFTLAVSRRLWVHKASIWISGAMTGLNPVLVFMCGDPNPTLQAMTWLSLAIWLVTGWHVRPTIPKSLAVGVSLCLAAAFQPILILLAVAWPVIAVVAGGRRKARLFLAAAGGLAVGVLLLAWVAYQVQGESSGGDIPRVWRMESAEGTSRGMAYRDPSFAEVDERQKQALAPDPSPLWLRAYHLLNTAEQPATKTYSYVRSAAPMLLFNPVHWGLLLLCAVAGITFRKLAKRDMTIVWILLTFQALILVGILVSEVTYKTRAPAIPMFAAFAGGLAWIPLFRRTRAPVDWRPLRVSLAILAAITYAWFGNARTQLNFANHAGQRAIALLRDGQTQNAIDWALVTLQRRPNDPMAATVKVLADFKSWALGSPYRPLLKEETHRLMDAIRPIADRSPDSTAVFAVYLWKLDYPGDAIRLWNETADRSALSVACLFWTDQRDSCTLPMGHHSIFTNLALQLKANGDEGKAAYTTLIKRMENMLAPAH